MAAPPEMTQQAEAAKRLDIRNENFALDRGILQPVDGMVPKPRKDATFHWKVQPRDGLVSGTLYTDGSQLDGPTPLLRRCGWALVAVDEDGEVMTSA